MKNIDRAFIDNLLSRIDIVEVINDRVRLKQHGNNHKGLCPFHAENTPSFIVSSSKQFYHCFGCGASGDVINFIKEYEGLTFVETVEKLSLLANIKIPETSDTKYDNHNKLLKINNFVLSIFENNLKKNVNALNYLKSRNISEKEIEFFNIGFANDGWDNITKTLKEKKITKEGIELGLLTENNNKIYDRFRNRIIFPIKNTMGNVIAFGGRLLDSKNNNTNLSEPAKYINSPESKLFYKSSQIYGLFEARQSISKANRIIVVEGYTDVIALHINGFKNVVATLGTAFTKSHLNKILRYTKNITFCFDGDKAGKSAAWKALVNSLSEIRDIINIEFIFLPDGKDPDQLCSEGRKGIFEKLLASSVPLSEFMFNSLKADLDLTKIEDKSNFISTTATLIQQIPTGVFKTLMEEKLSDIANIPRDELLNITKTQQKNSAEKNIEKHINDESSESYILSILLEYPSLLNSCKDSLFKMIQSTSIKRIIEMIRELNKKNEKINASIIVDNLPEDKDLILKCLTKEMIDIDEADSLKILESILSNLEKKYNEEQYFLILKKHSKGEKLTDEEKKLIKNFKK